MDSYTGSFQDEDTTPGTHVRKDHFDRFERYRMTEPVIRKIHDDASTIAPSAGHEKPELSSKDWKKYYKKIQRT